MMKSSIAVRAATIIFLCIFGVAGGAAQGQRQFSAGQNERLRQFLRGYVGPAGEEARTTRYTAAFVDLRGDGSNEVIVYVSGPRWCGTGGCTMLILAPAGSSYRVVTKTTVTRLPIRVLDTKLNGWHDISVVGGKPLYEAELSFDGTTYPTNPSVAPASRVGGTAKGRTVISEDAKDSLLYE
jgi:hypothetical protein